MTDDIKLEVIKKTQDSLGKYFKKPPLTEKLLKKPPFRFLHDIISAIIKDTGFLRGLFSDEELNSENMKDKQSKLAYLTKLIDVVKILSASNLTVRASKIIAGQEPTKTNELLQAIGKALDKKVDSTEVVQHYRRKLEKKSKDLKSKSIPTEEVGKNLSSRQSSQTRKVEKEKSSLDQKSELKSSGSEKLQVSKNEIKLKKELPLENAINTNSTEDKADKNENKVSDTPPIEQAKQRQSTSVQNKKSSRISGESSKENKPEERLRRRDSANKIKRNQHFDTEDEKRISESTLSSEAKAALNIETNEEKNKTQINGSLLNNESYNNAIDLSNAQQFEPKSSFETFDNRPRTSLRPPSARPISARPAAPRIRAKPDLAINEEIITPSGNISLIVDQYDIKEEDDADDMVVMESKGGGDSLDNTKIDDQLTQEHGHLVAQIIETQRELINTNDVDVIPKQVDIIYETGSKREREVMIKEIDKLRNTIQTLTRATNPLGKLFDYFQEDVEIMQKELLDWKNQYNQLNEQLETEQKQTEEVIEPMKESLIEIERNIKDQLDKICQVKARIIKNDQKIQGLLNGQL
ncbi:TRAF3-interacting protein 1 isoform X2 [Prorops nasuta]|uniref:TRAF3-interacting protein 1 isoform X2 n=1 Tax=Prorops nasuta TaxID=863751 RepID=UPI0034CFA97E